MKIFIGERLAVLYRLLPFQGSIDSTTGDHLTTGETVSWMIQRVMRRWAFLGVISLCTAYVWLIADPIWRHQLTDVWNLCASYLAIVIEGVTAMALINQTKRDAVVIREIRALAKDIRQIVEREEDEIQALDKDE